MFSRYFAAPLDCRSVLSQSANTQTSGLSVAGNQL